MADGKKPNILIDSNHKIKLFWGNFTSNNKLAPALMGKKTALIVLAAGITAGIALALLR